MGATLFRVKPSLETVPYLDVGGVEPEGGALKKISVMHVIKLGFAPVSFPPG